MKNNKKKPFVLFLSWGPPHNPYHTAPQKYLDMYDPDSMILPPNVPHFRLKEAQHDIAGYYAHCSALDDCIGKLIASLKEMGIFDNTIFVFTSDHGDMLGSKGYWDKQAPFDESIRVPFLIHFPEIKTSGIKTSPINSVDVMPTLLGLCNIKIPASVEGNDYSNYIKGGSAPDSVAYLACPVAFGNWPKRLGGREYRGIRTERYTYIRSLKEGAWLLYDNWSDPFQQINLVGNPLYNKVELNCEMILQQKMKERNDEFLPGINYLNQWGWYEMIQDKL